MRARETGDVDRPASSSGTERALRALAAVAVLIPATFIVTTLPGVRPHPGYNPLLDGWLSNTAFLCAPVLCLLRTRHVPPAARLPHRLLAAALALYGGGDLLWTFVVERLDPEPLVSVADLFYLSFYPLAFVALLLTGGRERRLRLSEWLDGLVGGLAVAAVAAALVAHTVVDATGGGWLVAATTMAYPLLDLVLLLVLVTTLSIFRWRPPAGIWLLTLGLLLFSAADLTYLMAAAHDGYVVGGPGDGLWVAAVTIMAASPGWPDRPMGTRLPTWGTLVAPTVSAFTALGLLIAGHARDVHPLAVGLAAATLVLALLRLVATIREVDSLAHSHELALTDELTGLGNRRALYELAADRIAELEPDDEIALVLLDLDRFKEVNDSLGHQAGDEMLRVVAGRLVAVTGAEPGMLVRLGGDEFAFLLVRDDASRAAESARRAHESLTAPVKLSGMTVWVGASIGITCARSADADLLTMLRQADVAMYQAKTAGCGVVVYNQDRDEFATSDRFELIERLHEAISTRAMVMHYQPKVESSTHRVKGVEALVRLDHPVHGLMYPGSFLPLLDEIGLMQELTDCILDQTLDQLVDWHAAGRLLSVAVNLPPSSLVDLELPARVEAMLAARGLPCSCLEVEITEEYLMADHDRARLVLAELRALGIRISVDDFGTGYSSLAYLKELPVDELKLDKSFLTHMLGDERATAIVRSTIGLAHSLGLAMVAEGVEDELTSQHLQSFGCDFEQGFLHSRPLPATRLESWIDGRTRPDDAGSIGSDAFLPGSSRSRT